MTTITASTATTATTATTMTSSNNSLASRQINQLQHSLSILSSTRLNATQTASNLFNRTQQLATLTSPASETSASLTQASANVTSILSLLRDAREKFDTVNDCEPSIERLHKGAQEIIDMGKRKDHPSNTFGVPNQQQQQQQNRNGNHMEGEDNDDDKSILELAQRSKRNLLANYNNNNNNNNTHPLHNEDDDESYTATATLTNMALVGLNEQDIYAAADSLEIIRDAYNTYFLHRPQWKSTPSAIGGLQRVHQLGVDAMSLLISSHLVSAGPALRMKRIHTATNPYLAALRGGGGDDDDTRGDSTIATNTTFGTKSKFTISNNNNNGSNVISHQMETAVDTRRRLSDALQNRDLMKSVGEYEECLPLDTRSVRELRAMYECLNGNNCFLTTTTTTTINTATINTATINTTTAVGAMTYPSPREILLNLQSYQSAASKVTRSEKIGSGFYTKLSKVALITMYQHLDAYSEARRQVAFQSMQQYYRTLRSQRKQEFDLKQGARSKGEHLDDGTIESADMDAAARDAVRCLEHAMVIVAGEKSIYRCVVSPTSSHTHDTTKIPEEYKYALVASYSHVCACVVDRVLDIIELFFIKDAGVNNHKNVGSASVGAAGASIAGGSSNLDNGPSTSFRSGSGANSANISGTGVGDRLSTAASERSGGRFIGIVAGGGFPNKALSMPSATLEDNESVNEDGSTSIHVKVPSVRFAASAATASLRILDGVRMLGPSLAKLCEISSSSDKRTSGKRLNTTFTGVSGKDLSTTSLASNLCICIHRSTVKSCAKALENLAHAVKHNPLDGEKNRPVDARVAAVSSDVVRAVRLVSPFVNAYRSVTKRRYVIIIACLL